MKKSKVGTWIFVIIVWLILAGIVSFGGFVLITIDHQVTLEGITKASGINTKNHYSAIEEIDESGYINKITITKK